MTQHTTPGDEERKRAILTNGLEALRRLHGDQSWSDWMEVGEALMVHTEDTLAALGFAEWDKESKRLVNEFNRRWDAYEARLDSNYKPISKQERWALRTVMTEPTIGAWRASLDGRTRRRLNHPNAVINKWKATTKPKTADTDKPMSTGSLLKQAKEQITQLQAHTAELEAARERDDNRFQPEDTADHIAMVLVGMFSPHKANDIAHRMLAKLKKPKAVKLEGPLKRRRRSPSRTKSGAES